MSIDNGWNRVDKAAEDDYDNGIKRADAIGKLAEEYEKKLLAEESIFPNGVEFTAEEVITDCDLDLALVFAALLTNDSEKIATCKNHINSTIEKLAEEHIDSMEHDDD